MTKKPNFTLIELIIVIAIIAITSGLMIPRITRWGRKQRVLAAGQNLFTEIILTQQMSLIREDGYNYFGIDFFPNQGPNNDRIGYKVLRYEPIGVMPPIGNAAPNTVIKSYETADSPQFHENHMLLPENVQFSAVSALDENDKIVFNPTGSATSNGTQLIPNSNRTIVLTDLTTVTTIRIEPITGAAEVF